jgi:signal transduction histidine kinase
MRIITVFLLSILFQPIHGQEYRLTEGNPYSDSLRAINLRIKHSYTVDDLSQMAKGHYERAMHNFSIHVRDRDVIDDLAKSAEISNYIKDDFGFYKARFALASFYIEEDIFLDEALKLTTECLDFYKSQDELKFLALAVTQLARGHQHKLNYDKAIAHVEEGLKLSTEIGDKKLILENRLLLAKLLASQGRVEKMIEQASYIIESEKRYGFNELTNEANFLIGEVLIRDQRKKEALPYLEEAVQNIGNVNDLAYQANKLLSQVYLNFGKTKLAYEHLQRANKITNELYDKEKYAMASQNAIKYQSYERKKEIKELEEENQLSNFKLNQRTRFFIILTVLLALAALAVYNYYRLQKHKYESERILGEQKEKIAKQKINDLENSLKIENLQAVISGQEAERTRISTDLHDSLGGMLSTLKLHYDGLQVEHEELANDEDYHRVMQLIDEACKDVRDISRNLKPVALEKLGMTAALKDLVNKYRVKGILDISINTNNVDGLLSKDSKLHVYRIIQELLNNALKHAQASEIDVLVNRADDGLVIMVQDNGQGFDPNTIKKGLGLDNLQSRVNVLRGEMEVDTSISRGTAVTVHIPLSIQNLMAPVLQIVD